MAAATLPAGADEHRADRVDQSFVRVGDDELDPAQAAGDQRPQEPQPAGAVFGGDQVDAEDLALPVGVDPVGEHDRDLHDPPALAARRGGGEVPRCAALPDVERVASAAGEMCL